ncbi:MAG: hypothetical protein A2667_03105 [Candidatus Wildermuthbacteria bacterium RIFCSPHIGHO2_01_FULL_47_27]|uniref:PAS domain-containing protein n=2 Tax=Candidatus Wildermuthiibacteriota TaxID=1817923 RepID=A0A1G2RLZ8_9BACT|nr:MAG: hypothetical protein A2667_03105 [Candidatus Wildermuthbacteria bacterium RIFCSPHIGHO2_01_FULL_47_27]OHA67988.1 MAG: hypothetical protein A3D59_02545 [Candidatus Wildermuthbacteria bacterium RIFCSPHIGHO2_02_FULL_47_17]OHA73847.1 MAG: hypothetical protein A3A32_02935 [Candidatus Wildermuthbacteria bacterium RIFCSPLOWO2_01_FULL_48_35]OHA76535.1 MAG: hypothetical protein A3I38_03610 [Candidatus Wildermuthbacteria bacterium RIFCSPLOWO2_02_FULL_47_10]
MPYRKPVPKKQLLKYLKEIKLLASGFDLLSDHVIITDSNANIMYANGAAERSTGFRVKEMIGKNPGDLWGGKMSPSFYRKMWRVIKTKKKPFVGSVRNLKKDGTAYWQKLCIVPVLDDKSGLKYFLGIEPKINGEENQNASGGD